MKLDQIKSIAIMRTSALGDIIWTLPMLNRIRKALPKAKIYFITSNTFAPLIEGIEDIELIRIDKPKKLKDYFKLKSVFAPYNFDVLLCTQANLRINFIYPFIKAKRKIGFDSKRGRDLQKIFINESIPFKKEHSVDAFLGFADYLGINSNEIEFNLPFTTEEVSQLPPKDFIVIHPKASSLQRTWSTKRYIELSNKIKELHNIPIVLTGIPSDKDICDSIEQESQADIINLCGKTSLNGLKNVFLKAIMVIAPDSGPAHMAAALNTPVIGLYTAVPPEYTGPFGQIENCINAYPRALEHYFHKTENDVPWRFRIKEDDMMNLITVEEVLEKVNSILK
ncbi:glycosyltransferase family 9 protein [Halobacteriovorax sp. XZX-3]|uniref:glycosyltransferase family 9 protein n=1 Tax=unclassified Halobacteriovorax TaxID=2639665 RepID=UPI0037124197